jgi:hypothetical protein
LPLWFVKIPGAAAATLNDWDAIFPLLLTLSVTAAFAVVS